MKLLLMPVVTVVLLASFAPPGAAATLEAIPWGQPEIALDATMDVSACTDTLREPERVCVGDLDIRGTDVRAYFWFDAGRLVRVSLRFHSDSFDHVARALERRFGPPTEQRFVRKTRSALTYTDEVLEWHHSRVSLRVDKYYSGYGGFSQAWLHSTAGTPAMVDAVSR